MIVTDHSSLDYELVMDRARMSKPNVTATRTTRRASYRCVDGKA